MLQWHPGDRSGISHWDRTRQPSTPVVRVDARRTGRKVGDQVHQNERGATPRDIECVLTDVESLEQIRSVIEQSVRGPGRIDRPMIVEGARAEHAHFTGTVEDVAEFACGERWSGTTDTRSLVT
jgi:hypothetical protein